MLSHGINVIGLFFVIEIIERRTKSRELAQLGGITQSSYVLTVSFIILSLGSVALPLTNGFIGEFILLKSIFDYSFVFGIVAGITIILGAVYTAFNSKNNVWKCIKNHHRIFKIDIRRKNGPYSIEHIRFIRGIFPNAILHFSEESVLQITQLLK